MTQYLECDMTIQPRVGDSYPLTIRTPVGEANGLFSLPSDSPEFQDHITRFAGLDTDSDLLSTIGRQLYDALFQGPIADVWSRVLALRSEGQNVRLRLHIAAEEGKVGALPWELLRHAEHGPLVLDDISIVRYTAQNTATPQTQARLPLRVLLTSAQRGTGRNAEQVLAKIQEGLAELGNQVSVVVEPHLTPSVLQRRLREPFHVWHIVGQGGVSENGTSGVLHLENGSGGDRALSATQLIPMIQGSQLRVVVLDASASKRLFTDPFRVLAPGFLQTQVTSVVAVQFAAREEASKAFAATFYRSLTDGLAIDVCVSRSRDTLARAVGLGAPDWATPVLFTRDPQAVMLDVPQADLAGSVVTGSANPKQRVGPYTRIAVHSVHGALLYAGPQPLVKQKQHDQPHSVPSFLNRERELRTITQELQARRSVWVRGSEGVGISALLRQVASGDAVRPFPDGVVVPHIPYANLDPADTFQMLFAAFCTSEPLLRAEPGATREYLSNARALLLFDRLGLGRETLTDILGTLKNSAAVVAAEGAMLPGLVDLQLPSMPRQDSTKLLSAEAGIEIDLSSVIFLDRVCAALGDLPLPLMLAGRLLANRVLTLKQLVAVLEDTTGELSFVTRAITPALKALSSDQRAVLTAIARCGAHGISREAISAISQIEAPTQKPILAHLSALGLIVHEKNHYRPATPSIARVLDTLLLKGDERARAATFFAGFAAANNRNLDTLEQELANLVGAVGMLATHNQTAEIGLLAQAIQPVLVLRGWWGAWGETLRRAEQVAQAMNNRPLLAWVRHEQGTRAALLGDFSSAEQHLREARHMRLELGDTAGADASQHNLRYLGFTPTPPVAAVKRPSRMFRLVSVLLALIVFGITAAVVAPHIGELQSAFVSPPTPTSTNGVVVAARETAATSIPTAAQTPTDAATPTTLPTATSAPSPTQTPEPLTCQVLVERLNLRAGPSTAFRSLAVLTEGAIVTPVARVEGINWVQVQSSLGQGWVSADPSILRCSADISTLGLTNSPAIPTPTTRRPTPRPAAVPARPPTPLPTVPPTEAPPTPVPPTIEVTLPTPEATADVPTASE